MARRVPWLGAGLLAIALGACADPGQPLAVTPPPGPPTPPAPERVVVVSGDGGQLLAFDPRTSTFEPLGPPVPSVGDYSRVRYAAVSLDPLRMLAVDASPLGLEAAYVSDGGPWRHLAEGRQVSTRFAGDLDLIWVHALLTPRGEDPRIQSVAMHHFDGRVLFARAERPADESARLIELGARAERFVLWAYPDGYTLHFVDGRRRDLPDDVGDLLWLFDTSMITRHFEPPTARWRDLDGRAVDRPGFTGERAHLSHRGPYQLVDGALSWLTDEGLAPLAALPASVRRIDLRRHQIGRYVIVEERDGLTAYSPDGSVLARYDAPALPRQARTNVDVSPRLPGPPDRYFVTTEHWGLDGDTETFLGRSEELWAFDDAGTTSAVHLARRGYDSNASNAALTSSAYFYVEGGRLVQVDFADGARREHTYEGGLHDAVVRQLDLPAFGP